MQIRFICILDSEGTNPGFGLEGFESFRLFQKAFASSSLKNFGLESGFGFESFESFRPGVTNLWLSSQLWLF